MANGKYGALGKAASFIVAFLGIGFFATAVNRFLGWDQEKSGWKAGAVTLGTTLLLFVGLKTLKQSGWARTVLVSGLVATGVEVVVGPVNEAGMKLGNWLRGKTDGQPALPGPAAKTQSQTQSYAAPQGFTGVQPVSTVKSGMLGSMPTPTQTSPAAPAAAAPATTVIYQAPKIPKPSTFDTIAGALIQAGGTIVGSYLGGSTSGVKGSAADADLSLAAFG